MADGSGQAGRAKLFNRDIQVFQSKPLRHEQLNRTSQGKSGRSRQPHQVSEGTQEQPDFARGAEIQKLLDASFESDRLQKPVHIQS